MQFIQRLMAKSKRQSQVVEQLFDIPKIHPLPQDINRPFFSVMIPTYNCSHFLEQTLESVLRQDLGPENMQIEVVDDCSDDNPQSVINKLGEDRIGFYQQPYNVAPTRNFNTCIERARGYWVHILHGDDLVEPSFYATMKELATKCPQAALLASRSFEINVHGELLSLSPRLESLESYSCDASPFFYSNPFRTPALVINRNFYENHGGFNCALIHAADWELCIRAVSTQGGIAVNQPLTRYRISSANHTSKLMRTGENLKDILKLSQILQRKFTNFNFTEFKKNISEQARGQVELFRNLGDRDAIRANYEIWWHNSQFRNKIYWMIKGLDYKFKIKIK